MTRQRDFDPDVLGAHTDTRLLARWNSPSWFFENRVWQFAIFVPRWFLGAEEREPLCTAHDLRLLEDMLQQHFGGYTSMVSPLRGLGRRGKRFEKNLHTQVMVIASRWRGTTRYFRALRKELEACSGEKQILILRQDLVIV